MSGGPRTRLPLPKARWPSTAGRGLRWRAGRHVRANRNENNAAGGEIRSPTRPWPAMDFFVVHTTFGWFRLV
jgi:hypothetical protein